LYGSSLALSGVGASLQGLPGLRLVQVDAKGTASGALDDLEPDVVVFDLATARPDVVELWTRGRPALPIGVDLLKHEMVVFSGETSRASTADDLLRVIESRMGPGATRPRAEPRCSRPRRKA